VDGANRGSIADGRRCALVIVPLMAGPGSSPIACTTCRAWSRRTGSARQRHLPGDPGIGGRHHSQGRRQHELTPAHRGSRGPAAPLYRAVRNALARHISSRPRWSDRRRPRTSYAGSAASWSRSCEHRREARSTWSSSAAGD